MLLVKFTSKSYYLFVSYAKEYKDCLKYIDGFWDKVTVKPRRRDKLFNFLLKSAQEKIHRNVLNMPHSFIVPNDKKFTHVFYWDTFFMFRGLIRTKREWLMKSMVDNFIYLYERHGIIPNFNSPASTGRSQPPFLTSMILDTYNGPYFTYKKINQIRRFLFDLDKYKEWLREATKTARNEYFHVWMDPHGFFHHTVNGYKLNRYGDRDVGYAHSSELESGWDFTSRFYNRCNEFLPIDLNVYLFKYERDFAKIAEHLDMPYEQKYWTDIALKRKSEINKYMWDKKFGFFFDYGYVYKRQSDFLSLAGFTPLWAGMASKLQSKKMIKKLSIFETDYGLTITAKESLAPKINMSKIPIRYRPAIEDVLKPKQWDYPNSWPPLEYLTVIGLLKYGYIEDAVRIMKKYLNAHAGIFRKYGTFFEKIDGIRGDKTKDFHYKTQSGFGWTNAIFYRYVQILDLIESGENIYVEPKSPNPPYKLSIPH